ncbi:D-Ala-D-Ala carboxypeptidase family metallohydrolase [Occallatibacter riparius]|uniref:D-Ala-D-Ala carboxypeptidase family metallohydrolase n=1 Tax=Occallatibacter riparius TaxID=1002689 RepID=A0A9J7BMQ9_9BACT|nr:D-Ala-D-Ala carboxypeptidase family metallohydrolase [Occallatibacter riparius]UWZ82477.1 D-Ala-D-Ala carboxypeptidase family metallohydrolase [Occallatibacter riparius]
MQLSDHFSLDEMTFSSTAVRQSIDNTPPPDVVEHLKATAAGLEQVRALLGLPLNIDSGYRCPALNHAVGGVPTSAHVTGYAADFVCRSFGVPLEIVKKIQADGTIQFDQLIQEGTWVHISFDPKMRGQVLTAHFVNGKATYTQGA